MAALTEAVHTARGRTVLYVPEEDLPAPGAAIRDKARARSTPAPYDPKNSAASRLLGRAPGAGLASAPFPEHPGWGARFSCSPLSLRVLQAARCSQAKRA
jgi:hypothetical protein